MANYHYPPEVTDVNKHPATMLFNFFERDTPYRSTPIDEIQLYMPEAVANPSTVSWDTEKLGFLGNYAATQGRNASANGASLDAVSGALDNARGAYNDADDLAWYNALGNAGTNAVALMGGQITVEGLMGTATGKIPNPYLTMVFRGVDFRSFSFVFKFTPYSEKDCDTIDNIIKTFRRNSLPEREGAFFKYPKECEISYHWRGQENKYMHRFKRAVCTALDVDYTGAGMFSVMRNGFPSTIIVSTKWSEIEVVTAEDVDSDFRSNGQGGF